MKKNKVDILLINPYRSSPGDVQSCNIVRAPNADKIYSNINLGLLSLATFLMNNGFTVKILDLDGADEPLKLANRCAANIDTRVIGISCLFHSSYLPMKELAGLMHRNLPASIIIAGGTHAGSIPQAALDEIPQLTAVCAGEAEDNLVAMMSMPPAEWHRLKGVYTRQGGNGIGVTASLVQHLYYDSYPGIKTQVFVMEESRGCPFDCRFCSHIRRHRVKPMSILKEEITHYLRRTSVAEPEIVVGSDTCGLSWKRLEALLHMLIEVQSVRQFHWGTQTRVDAAGFHNPEALELAVRSGLKSLSLGLESASPSILRLMHKTPDPKTYVESASRLVNNLGFIEEVNLRINVLLYAGENKKTAAETRAFLDSHRGKFAGIHTSVVHAYPGTGLWNDLKLLRERCGTTCVRSGYWDSVHAYPLNPSTSFDFRQAQEYALALRTDFNPMT
jgi:radical SAM superfamily enzyme YgiQ (UPF0313 family)